MTLERVVVDVSHGPTSPVVVMLHGFSGLADDFAPFARALRVPGRFIVPHGLVDVSSPGLCGRAWWPIDVDDRARAISRGVPRDLSSYVPEGLAAARAALDGLLDELARESPSAPLVLAGFSQGGMLGCDLALRTERPLSALAMFSSAPIAAAEWRPRYATRAGMRVFMSHGRGDAELSFAAAEGLKDELVGAGMLVTWCPFDGGHEMPLVVLRAFKKFLMAL